LLRKLPPSELSTYLEFIFDYTINNPSDEYLYGISYLLFQTVKGVKERFHSKALPVLRVMFSALKKDADFRGGIVLECIKLMCDHTTSEFSGDMWTILVDQSNLLLEAPIRFEILSHVVEILAYCVEFQHGRLIIGKKKISRQNIEIVDKNVLWTLATKMARKQVLSDCSIEYFRHYLQFLSNLVRQSDLKTRLTHLPLLLPTIYSVGDNINPALLIQLSDNLLEFEDIHSYLVPNYFGYLSRLSGKLPHATLQFIYFTINSRKHWVKSNIVCSPEIQQNIEKTLKSYDKKDVNSTAITWMAIQVCRLVKLQSKQTISSMNNIVKQLETKLETDEDIVLFCAVVESQLESTQVSELESMNSRLLKVVTQFPTNIKVLELYSMYLHKIKKQPFSKTICSVEQLPKMALLLNKNFIEPISKIRLVTLKLLLEFEQPLIKIQYEKSSKEYNLFQSLMDFEQCEKGLNTSRQLTLYLDQLESLTTNATLQDYQIESIFRYLFGIYNFKFSAAWPIAQKAIGAFGKRFLQKFAGLFYEIYLRTSSKLEVASSKDAEIEEAKFDLGELCQEENIQDESVDQYFAAEFNVVKNAIHDEKLSTDTITYFNLLVKSLIPLGRDFEQHTKILFDSFLRLFGSEESVLLVPKKQKSEILTSYLTVLSKYKAGVLHKSAEMKALFLELLTKPQEFVQLLLIQCLCSWNVEYVKPYREALSLFIKENSLKDQLVNFQFDTIQEVYIEDFTHVLMKILYSKMLLKGKGHQNDRRATILQFLVTVKTDHLDYFISLMTQPFEEIFNDFQVTETKFSSPSKIIMVPYKRIVGFIQLLDDILFKLKNIPLVIIHKFLHVLVYISWLMLQELDVAHVTKNHASEIRGLALKRIAQIYSQYDTTIPHYKNWSKLLFSVLKSPIEKLTKEYILNVSGLLELILVFSNSKEMVLELQDTPIIGNVLAMIGVPSVAKPVLHILLQFVDNIISRDEAAKIANESLLISQHYIDQLLVSFHDYIATLSQKKDEIASIMLRILSKLSQIYSIQPEQANKLVELLVPFLKSKGVEDPLKKILLDCVNSFVQFVDNKERIIIALSRLFYLYTNRETRVAMVKTFVKCASYMDKQVSHWAAQVANLNRYSNKSVDDYGYEVRLSAFTEIEKNLPKVDKILYQSILYNYLYYLRDSDMSIRNSANLGLHQFIEFMQGKPENLGLIQNVLFPTLKSTVVSTRESYIRQVLFLVIYSNAHKGIVFVTWKFVTKVQGILPRSCFLVSTFRNRKRVL
jgi:hypothetical protein